MLCFLMECLIDNGDWGFETLVAVFLSLKVSLPSGYRPKRPFRVVRDGGSYLVNTGRLTFDIPAGTALSRQSVLMDGLSISRALSYLLTRVARRFDTFCANSLSPCSLDKYLMCRICRRSNGMSDSCCATRMTSWPMVCAIPAS